MGSGQLIAESSVLPQGVSNFPEGTRDAATGTRLGSSELSIASLPTHPPSSGSMPSHTLPPSSQGGDFCPLFTRYVTFTKQPNCPPCPTPG